VRRQHLHDGKSELSIMLKLDENPSILFPDCDVLKTQSDPWWIAHTKSRSEKVFAWDLRNRQIPYFLPMVLRVRVSGGRKRKVMAPLFPGYVFFCGNDEARYKAMTTNRLCQTIEVREQEILLGELTFIERALVSKALLDPYPYAAVGRRCRIKSGPFMDLEGVVIQRSKATRIVLQVSILGQGASMEIEPELLEPAE